MERHGPNKKRNGKKGNQRSNIFALITNNRQDRSYYKSLYHFNSDVELAEYSLPIISDEKEGQDDKIQPGAVGPTGVQVRMGSNVSKQESMLGHEYSKSHLSGRQIIEEGEYEEGEFGEGDGEGEYDEEDMDNSLDSDTLEDMINTDDDQANREIAKFNNMKFIEKSSPLYKQRAEIKTGEQAISFFAKHGNNTPIKIFNCNRAKVKVTEFRPYDLEVVLDEKKLNEEYFTISNRGVVHVFKKNTKRMSDDEMVPTEFLAASDWMHQSTLFNVLSSMKFFKNYLIGKVFNQWNSNVRHKRFKKTREKLAQNLKFMRPAFQSSFLDINGVLYEMQKNKCYKEFRGSKQYELDNFYSEQKGSRDEVKEVYDQKLETITKKLEELIKEVQDSKNIKDDEEDFENSRVGQKVKHKAMTVVKKEEQTKVAILKLAKKNISNLGTFIRLIDYMVVETQVKINQEGADTILTEMSTRDESNKICGISTKIDFDEKGMVFSPTESEFIQQFDKLLGDMLQTCSEINRVIQHHNFNQYTQGLVSNSGLKFKDIVDRSEDYQHKKRMITDKFLTDFKDLGKEAARFEDCRKVRDFETTFDFEDFKAAGHSLDAIREKLEELRRWDNLINASIKSTLNKGIVIGSGKELRGRLQDKVNSALKDIRGYLYSLGEAKCAEVQEEISRINKNLEKPMESLNEYVEYVRLMNEAEDKKLAIEQLLKDVDMMNNTLRKTANKNKDMNTFGIVQSDHTTGLQTKYEMQHDSKEKMSLKLEEKKIIVEDQKELMIDNLGKGILDVKEKMIELSSKINVGNLKIASTPAPEACSELEKLKKRFDEYRKRAEFYLFAQEILKLEKTAIQEIADFDAKWDARYKLWKTRADFEEDHSIWFESTFQDQDAQEIEQKLKQYNKDALSLKSRFGDPKDEVFEKLSEEIRDTMVMKDLIQDLGNKALMERHWIKIFKLLPEDTNYSPNRTFTLAELKADGIVDVQDKVAEISAIASGEFNISQNLKEIQGIWKDIEFIVVPYRDYKDKFILGTIEDIMIQLEDDQVTIQTMLGSKNVNEIRAEVEEWEYKLSYISDLIDEWLSCQRQWMYLENIFSAEDIQKQLPNESKQFQKVDKFWRETMSKTHKNPSILATCESDVLLKRFQSNNKILDDIQKCLEDYLGTKRASFPRFFFLSNDELLQILSQTRNPQAVQPHLRKCFDGMASIVFTPEKKSKSIIAMISADGERVEFSNTVMAEGAVEFWLTDIEKMMVKSLYDQCKNCVEEYPENALQRREWFFTHPAQLVLSVAQVYWTQGCTNAISEIEKGKNKKALDEWLDFSTNQINNMVDIVRGDLTEHQRTLMGALIVIDVHARVVVQKMVASKVNNINNFEWTKQLRYYWEEDEEGGTFDCFAKQTNTRFRYGYEFLGNGPRLVITPLTDKCYMTLTGALHLNYGGNPQGPAGTGKTETTKDLAKALAIPCVVFNCSDGLDYKMMGRFFSGLAQGGAWSCFDEFNRIDIEVLSVIAQQMLTIQTAVKQLKDEFLFLDKIIPLNRRFGVFITMNPGYAGRTELPDNLKALFRPVSMMIPDYRLIAEIILFSEGFETASDLARKMVQLYRLSSEQLSKQKHYDFGMRAVKSVLVMAGALRRKDPQSPENIILIRAMRDSNVPKFLEHDLPLFEGIVTDLFPGVEVPFIDYGLLQTKIEGNLEKRKYQKTPKLIKKTIQLLETMLVRHGNMIVGEAATGKTTILEVLADALTELHSDGSRERLHAPVEKYRLNPKSVTRGELFGYTNILTNEWTDGLVSKLVNDAVESDKPDNLKWIIFDGPVDALWIENMNTVLDDNKTLCLTNGQRIKLPPTVTMVFEVMDLKVASPATVSRCGMVYLEPVHLGWEPLIETWKIAAIERDPDSEIYMKKACDIIEGVFRKGLPFIREKCKEIIPSVDANLVTG